jgi:phosphoglycolate phosphatase
MEALLDKKGLELIPPDSNFCSGKVVAISIRGIPCAVIAPAEEVRVHGRNIIEIISKVRLKDALNVEDGDTISIYYRNFDTLAMKPEKLVVDTVIFDLDGTLVNSPKIYFEILEIVFAKLDLPPVSKASIRDAIKNGEFDWNCVLPEDMLDRKDELIVKARAIIDDVYPPMLRRKLKLIPGAGEILKDIRLSGKKIGLVTSTPASYMPEKLIPFKEAGVDDIFEVIITADDVQKKKPAGDPLIECMQRLDVAPTSSVYVGDSRVDIMAGKAAGMNTIGVLSGFDDYDALNRFRPDAIINSVAELPEILIFCNSRFT